MDEKGWVLLIKKEGNLIWRNLMKMEFFFVDLCKVKSQWNSEKKN